MDLAGSTVKLATTDDNRSVQSLYRGHRFPREIIRHAVWLYHRFSLTSRYVGDLLAGGDVNVCY